MKISLLATIAMLSSMAIAKTPLTSPIETDRPDFTETAHAVPEGWLQIENGITYEGEGELWSLPESLLRYGTGRGFEWRLEIPSYFDTPAASGFGDLGLGLKMELPKLPCGDVAFLLMASIPSGDRPFRSDSIGIEGSLILDHELSPEWSLGTMSTLILGDSAPGFAQTFAFERGLSKDLSFFAEYAGEFSAEHQPSHLAHFGFAHLLDANTQVDLHFGFGLSDPAPTNFIGLGLSLRR